MLRNRKYIRQREFFVHIRISLVNLIAIIAILHRSGENLNSKQQLLIFRIGKIDEGDLQYFSFLYQ